MAAPFLCQPNAANSARSSRAKGRRVIKVSLEYANPINEIYSLGAQNMDSPECNSNKLDEGRKNVSHLKWNE